MEYYCPHQGKEGELSMLIQTAIKAGKIRINDCLACDFNIPKDPNVFEILEANSLDITCVGPESSDCPDPDGVRLIDS